MPRSNSWRHNSETRERLLRVYGLHVRGLTHAVIAALLRVSERTVARDLDRLHTLWQEQRRDFLDRERLRCLGSLREIDRLLWTKLDAHKADENPTNLTRLLRVFLNGQREARRLLAAAEPPPDPPPPQEEPFGVRDLFAEFTDEELDAATPDPPAAGRQDSPAAERQDSPAAERQDSPAAAEQRPAAADG